MFDNQRNLRFENSPAIDCNSWTDHGKKVLAGVCWPASSSSVLMSLEWFYFVCTLTGDSLKYRHRYNCCFGFLSNDVNDLELHSWVSCLAGFQTPCHTWPFRASVKKTDFSFSIYFMWPHLWEIDNFNKNQVLSLRNKLIYIILRKLFEDVNSPLSDGQLGLDWWNRLFQVALLYWLTSNWATSQGKFFAILHILKLEIELCYVLSSWLNVSAYM